MFLSIFAATCRPANITKFLDNLAETADDLSSFEVLLKIDEGDNELATVLENYQRHAKFSVKFLSLPKLDGYYSLEVGYNELLKIMHKDSYFCWLLTDEIRFATKGWDSILKKYIGFYPDNIFRLKLSIFQLKNYLNFFECLPCPDNYAVTTKKWLEVTGGWGNFWGPDSWHQCVDFYLALCKNDANPYGIWRSLPVFDIKVDGQEAGQIISNDNSIQKRTINIARGWAKHSTHAAQENFFKLAQQLNAHICASALNCNNYELINDVNKKELLLKIPDMTPQKFSYSVAKFRIHFLIGYKFIDVLPWFKNKILKSYFFVRNTSDDPKIPYILRLPFRIVMRTGRITKRTIKRVVRGDRHHVVM